MTFQPPDQHPCGNTRKLHLKFYLLLLWLDIEAATQNLCSYKIQNELTMDELGAGHFPPRAQLSPLCVL